MKNLSQGQCEPCRVGSPRVSQDEASEYLQELPGWTIRHVADIDRLTRHFTFKDFSSALAFTNRVGALAESQGHHPTLTTEWGRVEISWWTHKIQGLHQNDFIMAARTDQLYAGA